MGIRASYWLTGGIMAVLGLAVARIILGFLGGLALAVGVFLFKATITLLAVWLVLRLVRGRRRNAVT